MSISRGAFTLCSALALLTACEIEEVAIPQTKARVAVHAILSATAPAQVLLLERTRTGAVNIVAPPFENGDPFGGGEGIAEPNATVTLTTPNGTTLFAREDLSPGGSGAGIDRFALPGTLLERNKRYQLSITTVAGEVLTAETVVPGGATADFAEQRVFNRSADSLLLTWPAVAGARSYLVRIESPFGPRVFFTEGTSVRLTGDLRNPDVTTLPHVFLPGFPQAVTVSAVDSNFYDWFRSQNDEYSGTGLINRVTGGLGVFGSLVRLRFQDLAVVAPQTEREAGVFRWVGTPEDAISAPYSKLELYIESRAARSDQADAVSGRYSRNLRLGDVGCATCGLLGSVKDGHVELMLLKEWFASDTADAIIGDFHGDTIVGRYRVRAGVARFVRER